ncbi:MAG: glycosyltransferase 87 family protein [Candidatus Odinarchaeota archaeon]
MSRNRDFPLELIFIYLIILLTGIFTIIRIIFYLPQFEDNALAILRDYDYSIFIHESQLGIFNFHMPDVGSFYLYFWYFMFFPFSLIPIQIGVYIWDIARIISVIYIFKNVRRISNKKKNIFVFLILSTIGYFADAYLNNSNWVVGLLLFVSYIQLEKDNKWISGILFALTLYKLTPILFPIILLVVKKIKLKDIIYYAIPTIIILLPYIIFPQYFLDFIHNLTIIRGVNPATVPAFIKFLRIIVKAFQTGHMIFYSFLMLIFLENIKDPKLENIFRIIIFSFLLIIGSLAPLFAMFIFG